MILASIGFLERIYTPSCEQIREFIDYLCRFGTYQRVEDAILLAAERLVESRKQAVVDAPKRAASRKKWRRKAGIR